MAYVDGFVVAVPTANRETYIKFAQKGAALFKEYGALSVIENWGDDVPEGKVTSFPLAVKCEPGETVVFSWVTWPSKEVRNEGWASLMKDPRMAPESNPMPFDGKRIIYGGFQTVLET
jgi:uncharacterized protein YbaA (DUF1428 family)